MSLSASMNCLPSCLQQKQAEMEEEFIVNKLMKRLDQLKKEKQVLANEVSMLPQSLCMQGSD